jgi:hypothetical protein
MMMEPTTKEQNEVAKLTSKQLKDLELFKSIFPEWKWLAPNEKGKANGRPFVWMDQNGIVGIATSEVKRSYKLDGHCVIAGYVLARIKDFSPRVQYVDFPPGEMMFLHLFSGMVISIAPRVDSGPCPLQEGYVWKDDEDEDDEVS